VSGYYTLVRKLHFRYSILKYCTGVRPEYVKVKNTKDAKALVRLKGWFAL